jgi:transposase-like protein
MSKKQLSKNKPRPYAPEFRRQMVELVRAGRTPEQLAKEFEPSAQAIRNWVAQADRDEGRREDGLTTVEREELSRLPATCARSFLLTTWDPSRPSVS